MRFCVAAIVLIAGCGRVGYDPVASGRCPDAHEPNDTIALATPLAVGASVDATLCPGDVDVFAVDLAAGQEIEATVTPMGPGWPTIELRSAGAVRTVETLEPSSSMFADRDGPFYVVVGGLASAVGTPYRLAVTLRGGHHVFVAPTGDDASPGTFEEPWRHLDVSVDRLVPGDVLVLEDGLYGPSEGALSVDCSSGAVSGTPEQPIRIAALTERAAEVTADGSRAAAVFRGGCAWWTIEGLHLENADLASSTTGEGLYISASDHIVARRVLAAHSNPSANVSVISVYNSSNVLVEECEVYDFHRSGISVWNGEGTIVRRNYAASRSSPESPSGSGFDVAGTTGVVLENNVDEGNGAFSAYDGYGHDLEDTRIIGNAALNDGFGFISSIFDGTSYSNSRTQVVDHVSIGARSHGFYFRSNEDASCVRCTSIGSAYSGWVADVIGTAPRPASASCTGCLAVDNVEWGFRVDPQPNGWSVHSSNAFGNDVGFEPTGVPELVNTTEIDPALGDCYVYLPAGSPMRSAASGGGDIGAQILYRYVDGTLTGLPLWHPITGVFPCGSVVAGVNDDPDTSCIGVHRRLHVGTAGCPLPYPAP